ncbi:MAG: RNase P subunit p30 family protein [Candidatus Nanohaloarchaea archaeon]|nr:RNase P subunit p30 family protein [Candidatus Nanohaloarchaea archaeon]
MSHTFHDLNLQTSLSSGNSSIEEIVQRADTLGIDHIAITDYLTDHQDLQQLRDRLNDLPESEVTVHSGVKIRADDERELKDKLSAFRDHVEVVIVHGGDVEINRAACEDTRVDILAHPEFKRKDSGIDHVITKKAAENRVCIEITFRSLLKTYGKLRSQIMSHMQRNVRLCKKYEAPLILNSGARSIHEMRQPRDMLGLAQSLGIDLGDSFALVEKHPAAILERADDGLSGNQIMPVVEVEDDD